MKPSIKFALYVVCTAILIIGLHVSGGVPSAAAQQIQVTAADPPEGAQGTINLNVIIKGKGFKNGALAKFFVTGTTNPGGIKVNSTAFRGATELLANIDIADTADLAKFDIQVQNGDGRTGKGTELFSVTPKVTGKPVACPWPVPVLTAPTTCASGSGCLDISFGIAGIAMAGPGTGSAKAVAIQSDGGIVVAGSSFNAAGEQVFAVFRYNHDGSLDAGFGTGGKVEIEGATEARAVTLQPADGKIVVAGSQFWIVRLNPDGSLDTTFGVGGKRQVPFDPLDVSFADVALQSDGKIVAAGDGLSPGRGRKGATTRWKIARLTSDGNLDDSFGSGGKLEIVEGARVGALVIQRIQVGTTEEERILVGGKSHTFMLMRLNTNGSTDTTFGPAGTGIVMTELCGANNWLRDLALDPANNILSAGFTGAGDPNGAFSFVLARYTMNGILDTGFGVLGTGIVITNIFGPAGTSDFSHAVAVQTDGKIVLGGGAATFGLNTDHFALVRYNPDGTLDPLFGVGGAVALPMPWLGEAARGMAIQPDGRIVLVGSPDFAVIRIWP